MKKIFFFRFLVICTFMLFLLPAKAEEVETLPNGQQIQYDRVLITLHDSNTYEIAIDSLSSISSYDEGNGHFVLVVNGSGAYYYTFAREDVKIIKFLQADDQSVIEDLQDIFDEHTTKVTFGKDGLKFHPSTAGKVCRIQDLSGKIVHCFAVKSPFSMSCHDLPKGIYLVTVENYTLKIMLR